MTAVEVQRLREYPLIEIGAHGVHHLSISQVSAEECHREVFESRSTLERVTGQPVTSFAYPFADLSSEAVSAVEAAGFHCAVSRELRGLRAREHPFRLPRIGTCEESGDQLVARLARIVMPNAIASS
jgi:peptidoglycan/xylan/chitin deacetylase (PgdA/CDA1 family)